MERPDAALGARAWGVVGMLLAGYLVVRVLSAGRLLLVPLLVGLVVIYPLNPVVGGLARRECHAGPAPR